MQFPPPTGGIQLGLYGLNNIFAGCFQQRFLFRCWAERTDEQAWRNDFLLISSGLQTDRKCSETVTVCNWEDCYHSTHPGTHERMHTHAHTHALLPWHVLTHAPPHPSSWDSVFPHLLPSWLQALFLILSLFLSAVCEVKTFKLTFYAARHVTSTF